MSENIIGKMLHFCYGSCSFTARTSTEVLEISLGMERVLARWRLHRWTGKNCIYLFYELECISYMHRHLFVLIKLKCEGCMIRTYDKTTNHLFLHCTVVPFLCYKACKEANLQWTISRSFSFL